MPCLLRYVEILGNFRACSLTRFLGFYFLLQLISEIYRNAQVRICSGMIPLFLMSPFIDALPRVTRNMTLIISG